MKRQSEVKIKPNEAFHLSFVDSSVCLTSSPESQARLNQTNIYSNNKQIEFQETMSSRGGKMKIKFKNLRDCQQ